MELNIHWVGALVAGLAAMVPGVVIYMPPVLGNVWMKELGIKKEDQQGSAVKAMLGALAASIITAAVVSAVFWYVQPGDVTAGIGAGVALSVFALTVTSQSVFFEGRSWRWFGIVALNQILSYAVIGGVLSFLV